MKKKLVFLAGILLVAAGIFAAYGFERAEAKPKWEVEGHLAEACPCDVICPCNYAKAPTHGTCDSTVVLQFDKGRYEDVVLDGLYAITTVSVPEPEAEGEPGLKLSFSRIYLDERANESQRKALEEIARSFLANYLLQTPGEPLSPDEAVTTVPIQASVTLERAEAKIPNVLDFNTERLMKPGSREPWEIVGRAMDYEWMPQIWAGKSKIFKYSDAREWDHSGRNAQFGHFKAHSEMAAFQRSAGASQD